MIHDKNDEFLRDLFRISFELFEVMNQFDWLNQQVIVETIFQKNKSDEVKDQY